MTFPKNYSKVIPKKRVSRPDQAARIENEILIQSKMKHRNIAALLSAWSDDEKYILVIEYCEEKTLLCYMKLYANKVCFKKNTWEKLRKVSILMIER